ncbi:hypothetical protein GR157_24820 [Burkholderia sp. 4701]|nr:hypothetical protein [Burkholderia sp. 4701]MXN87081.1 hypothetical protein [Burkholderia sp. 4812]
MTTPDAHIAAVPGLPAQTFPPLHMNDTVSPLCSRRHGSVRLAHARRASTLASLPAIRHLPFPHDTDHDPIEPS